MSEVYLQKLYIQPCKYVCECVCIFSASGYPRSNVIVFKWLTICMTHVQKVSMDPPSFWYLKGVVFTLNQVFKPIPCQGTSLWPQRDCPPGAV